MLASLKIFFIRHDPACSGELVGVSAAVTVFFTANKRPTQGKNNMFLISKLHKELSGKSEKLGCNMPSCQMCSGSL